MQIFFLTLFPKVFHAFLNSSLLEKAQKKKLVTFNIIPIRDFAKDKHKRVDDSPYGGGEGMLLKADVLYAAWKHAIAGKKSKSAKTILLSPQGQLLTQSVAKKLTRHKKLIFVCGHYEGVDERFIKLCVDEEISIGNYVLMGGELPALVLAETVVRLLPGVVGNAKSLDEDSLEHGLLKYPQYTRPKEFMGLDVPEVLLSGNHKAVLEWKTNQRLMQTKKKRPDLC
ncbi:MAG: tRNA (guanosine(37)-N1)-methyltransferase TrmD [Bdellovibrio sp.]|nr:tRNA (guanosine(37)-N1)-methyltransferase TrmD [Bdellovibrio sp.]